MNEERLTDHNGYGVGFDCPNNDCDNDTAWIDYSTDEKGVLNALLLECAACGEASMEAISER